MFLKGLYCTCWKINTGGLWTEIDGNLLCYAGQTGSKKKGILLFRHDVANGFKPKNVVTISAECGSIPYILSQTTFSSWMQGIHKRLLLSKHLAWSVGSMALQAGSLGQALLLMEKQKIWLTALSSTMDALHFQAHGWSTWQLYFTLLLPLSWVQIHLAPASCPDPQSMEKNGVPALPFIRDHLVCLADVFKLLPDPLSYRASE